jgi:iron(III) transport system substrate-binding protein
MGSRGLTLAALAAMTLSCHHRGGGREVVVYTSVDQVYSEPVFRDFESTSGIRVLPVYDVEAAKTTGLVNRLIEESRRPVADVFWDGEFAQMALLKSKGVLQIYRPAKARPGAADPAGYWTLFCARARVLLINTRLAGPAPTSIFELGGEHHGLASPLFGTSYTHAAALYAVLGREKARTFFENLKARGVRIAEGNSVVRDLVVKGELAVGITDTDDAAVALARSSGLRMVFPDQDTIGTLVIPNSVALIAGAAHPDEGRALIDFLLSEKVDRALVAAGWSSAEAARARAMHFDPESLRGQMDTARRDLTEIFLR